jgi:hypothetical protein
MERKRVAASLPARPAAHSLTEEKHYTPKELAALWGFSPATIRNLIRDEPGVLRLEGMGQSHGRRSYTTYSIPESVALRVHERLAQKPLKAQLPRRDPRRVVFLRNRDRRVA